MNFEKYFVMVSGFMESSNDACDRVSNLNDNESDV